MPNTDPIVVQGSSNPVFHCKEVARQLLCSSGCGQILIDGYEPESFAHVGIECFKCKTLNWTPDLERGEVFAAPIMTIGNGGRFLVAGTVELTPGVMITCDSAIASSMSNTAPRDGSLPMNLSPEGLDTLVGVFDGIVGNRFALQQGILKREGNSGIQEFPFCWAITHLQKAMRSGEMNASRPDTMTALFWLNLFCSAVGTWQHHPRFSAVAPGLGVPKSFIHTAYKLITAGFLFRSGNRIGLSLEDERGTANPDLYIRTNAREKLFIEVKAPLEFQWSPGNRYDEDRFRQILKQAVKRSASQINRTHPGILIVVSSLIAPFLPNKLESLLHSVIDGQGRNHHYLAAIGCASPSRAGVEMKQPNTFVYESEIKFSVAKNLHYRGSAQVVIAPREVVSKNATSFTHK